MTRDEITSIAREAGFVGMDGLHKGLCRFAALVAAAEREACIALHDNEYVLAPERKENKMQSCNWMVVQANEARKALINNFGYSLSDVNSMNLREMSKELKRLGYVWAKRNGHGVA
jgi:hypothetical protein